MTIPVRKFWPLMIPVVFFAWLVLASGPLLLMQKALVFLCLPAGLVWVMLTFAIFFPGINRWGRGFLTVMWLIYTLGGNPLVGNYLLRTLETPYLRYVDESETFDILFVLGGGTRLSPNGTTQIGAGGDRVLHSARLYYGGQVRVLGASGRSITEVSGDRDLSQETIQIWSELGIPRSDTVSFSTPRNTREEIIAYREFLESRLEMAKVGICTSGWHMRRTERLWKSYGLEATPVPCDFRSRPIPWLTTYLIPKKRGFADVQIALWEYLGWFFS